jgi:hypothetical protein
VLECGRDCFRCDLCSCLTDSDDDDKSVSRAITYAVLFIVPGPILTIVMAVVGLYNNLVCAYAALPAQCGGHRVLLSCGKANDLKAAIPAVGTYFALLVVAIMGACVAFVAPLCFFLCCSDAKRHPAAKAVASFLLLQGLATACMVAAAVITRDTAGATPLAAAIHAGYCALDPRAAVCDTPAATGAVMLGVAVPIAAMYAAALLPAAWYYFGRTNGSSGSGGSSAFSCKRGTSITSAPSASP